MATSIKEIVFPGSTEVYTFEASNTVSVTSITYQSGTSATTAPTGTWSTTVPSVTKGNYLWTRIALSNGDYAYTAAYQGKDGASVTIVDNLTSDSASSALSAKQGKVLKGLIDGKTSNIGTITGITMNGSSKGTSGNVDLGNVLTTVNATATVDTGTGTPSVTVTGNGTSASPLNFAFKNLKGVQGDSLYADFNNGTLRLFTEIE